MIDIQLIRDNPELVKQKSAQKQVDVDVELLLRLDSEHKDLLQQTEKLRQRRNEISSQMKGGKPEQSLVDEGKQVKVELADREEILRRSKSELQAKLSKIPNLALDHVPIGDKEEDNVVVKNVGQKPKFGFKPKPHWEIANKRGLMDKERAAKISGSRFVYLKGGLVQLQFAIMQFVTDTLTNENVIKQLIDRKWAES